MFTGFFSATNINKYHNETVATVAKTMNATGSFSTRANNGSKYTIWMNELGNVFAAQQVLASDWIVSIPLNSAI